MKTALLSVSDKTGLVEFAQGLVAQGYRILSTGGTQKVLAAANIAVTPVEDVTHFPEMLDGRVKTLHPAIHAALLAKRDDSEHMAKGYMFSRDKTMKKYEPSKFINTKYL